MSGDQYSPVLTDSQSLAALKRPYRWLVTGGAGFIGSHLASELLFHGQQVTLLDDFSTGLERNIEYIRSSNPGAESALSVQRGSCADRVLVRGLVADADFVLHQAALGSIPRSFADPVTSDLANVHGFLTVLSASLESQVRGIVFASSSSVYGDSARLPKIEGQIGLPLSPYAVSKLTGEHYARVLAPRYPMTTVCGLRYFNVFGPRQNPRGAYAAVIPRWISEMLLGMPTTIFGDGSQSRDFCYVANVVQANIRAALQAPHKGESRIYNVAAGARTSLLQLHGMLRDHLADQVKDVDVAPAQFDERRPGDIPHSHADISRAMSELGYHPSHSVDDGIRETVAWFLSHREALS